MPAEFLRRDTHGAVAVLTLDRPPVNALNFAMYEALLAALDEIERDRSVRVLVLTTAPGMRLFSAGADIKEFDRLFAGESMRFWRIAHEVPNRIEALPIVTIAAVDGAVLGGGAELVLAFDLRVFSRTARIGFPEITVGQFPGTGGTMRLPWLIGESAAKAMLIGGEPVAADRAHALGLVHRLSEPGEACKDALAWAEEIARRPAQGAVAVKRSILRGRDRDVGAATRRDIGLSEWVLRGADAVEGHRAFLEKRQPGFSHVYEPPPDEPAS
jgi:enoyl-CoA hydratase/carnithine racemase